MVKPYQEFIGWLGAFIIILAYVLVSFNLIQSDEIIYQLLNIIGAMSMFYIAFKKKVYQSCTVNTIWITVALVAIFKIIM